MPPDDLPQRGEIWMAWLDPIVGREQGGRRPVLVVSSNNFNALPSVEDSVSSPRGLFAGHHVRVLGAFLLMLFMTDTAIEKGKATLLVDIACQNDELTAENSILA